MDNPHIFRRKRRCSSISMFPVQSQGVIGNLQNEPRDSKLFKWPPDGVPISASVDYCWGRSFQIDLKVLFDDFNQPLKGKQTMHKASVRLRLCWCSNRLQTLLKGMLGKDHFLMDRLFRSLVVLRLHKLRSTGNCRAGTWWRWTPAI